MNKEKEIKNIRKLIALHLLPGIFLSIVYVLLIKSGIFSAYPRIVVLGISALFSIVPAELGYLLYAAKKEEGSRNIFKIAGLKGRLKVWEYVIYTVLLLLLTGILMTALKPVSNYILNNLFGWMPGWYNYVQDLSLFSKNLIITAILVSFFILALIAPIVEELYFRGFLLARMKWMGKYGVILNVALFSIYHFWSPWLILARIVAFLPLFYVVYRKDSLKLGIFVHCLANFTDVVSFVMLL